MLRVSLAGRRDPIAYVPVVVRNRAVRSLESPGYFHGNFDALHLRHM